MLPKFTGWRGSRKSAMLLLCCVMVLLGLVYRLTPHDTQALPRYDSLAALQAGELEDANVEYAQLEIPDIVCYAAYDSQMEALFFVEAAPDEKGRYMALRKAKLGFPRASPREAQMIDASFQIGSYEVAFVFAKNYADAEAQAADKPLRCIFSDTTLFYQIRRHLWAGSAEITA